jgi:hypothetical protein
VRFVNETNSSQGTYITLNKASITDASCQFLDRIGGVMVSKLASSAVGRRSQSLSGQTKYYKIGIRCFSAKHAALSRKSKDWLARNRDNVFEWGDMSIRGFRHYPLLKVNLDKRL